MLDNGFILVQNGAHKENNMDYEIDYNEFPAWLRTQMEQTPNPQLQTLEGISRKLHVSRTTLYNWVDEADRSRPRPESARRLARLFGVEPEVVLRTYTSRKPGRKAGT